MMDPKLLAEPQPSVDFFRWYFEDKLPHDELTTFLLPITHGTMANVFNPAVVPAIIAAGPTGDMCADEFRTEGMDLLCAALVENSAYIYGGQVDFPVELCHSPDDTTIPLALSSFYVATIPNYTWYDPVEDFLAPVGSHAAGNHWCAGIATASYYMAYADDLEALAIPQDDGGAVCPGMETSSPTGSPIDAPSLSRAPRLIWSTVTSIVLAWVSILFV